VDYKDTKDTKKTHEDRELRIEAISAFSICHLLSSIIVGFEADPPTKTMKKVWIRFDAMKDEARAVQQMAGKVPILGRRVKDYAIAPEHLSFIEGLGVLFYVTGQESDDGEPIDLPSYLTVRGGARKP
jgi:hypothetical protein